MLVRSSRVRRSIALCLGGLLVAFAVVLTPVAVSAIDPTPAFAAPVDCTPVGVEQIGDQLYYVENCFGYNVYRPL